MKSYYILFLWLFFTVIYNKYGTIKSLISKYEYNRMIKYLKRYTEKQINND